MLCCEAITVGDRENIKLNHFLGKENIKLYSYSILIFVMMSSSLLDSPINNKQSYRQISNISHTKSQNLNDSHPASQLSLPNPLKPGIKWRMKMLLELLQLHLSDQQFY